MSTHPLEVPEILTRIGQYLPLWVEQDEPDLCDRDVSFKHQTLWSCMQVSKLWHQTLLPILWYSYDGLKMGGLPQEVISRYSPYFKNFRSPGCHAGPFLSTHLVELTIYIQMMDPPISLATQRDLVRTNTKLRYLEWHGPDVLTDLNVKDFVGLRGLQDLRLFHWNGSERRLAKVLRAVAGTLKALEVSRLQGVLPGELSAPLKGHLDQLEDSNLTSATGNDDYDGERGVVLPCLEKLKVIFDKNPDYVELATCCPNLEKLTVAGLGHGDTSRLARCLRDHCQKLTTLVLKDVLLPQEDAINLLCSCLAAQGPGGEGRLVKVHIDVYGLQNDLISAILMHASTLEKLTIASAAEDEDGIDLDGVPRIMVGCERLKSLRFILDTMVPDVEVLDIWRVQEWRCTLLERLELEFNHDEFEDMDDGDGNCDENEARSGERDQDIEVQDESKEAEGEESDRVEQVKEGGTRGVYGSYPRIIISSEVAFMGWYRHPQESHDFDKGTDQVEEPALRTLFEMAQGLPHLRTLVWNHVEYSRSRIPPKRNM
ncbi:hypothetical protein BGX23_002089 [Mortierella sp. AD031]|nr:hypothetical protein BGX23_002089 [Mortierella sp. AD031]